MVTLKVDSTGVDPTASNGFEPYEGALPTPGSYAAVIKSMRIRISQAGNPYFNVLFEFADQVNANKQEFKGYPLFEKIVPGESDIQKERVGKLAFAVCGKVKANVEHDEVTDGGKVTKFGGKDPVGTRVRIVVTRSSYNGEPTVEMRDMFAWPKDQPWPEGEPESEEDGDVEVEEEPEAEEESEDEAEVEEESDEEEADDEEEEEEEEGDDEYDQRVAELADLDRTALKKVLKGLDPDYKILTKHTDDNLREAILGLEFEVPEGDDGDEPPF